MAWEHAAFLSYSHHDAAWVEVLQTNLEACLGHLGHQPATVFRDKTDIGPGQSWVLALQQGLDRAAAVVLVATPESLASPRVGDEWESLIAGRRDWKQGRLQVVRLVDCPLPSFPGLVQGIDFTGHDEAKYRDGLQKLLAGLLGHTDYRNLPELADGLTVPDPPVRAVPAKLRAKLVDWLEARLRAGHLFRLGVASALGLEPGDLEDHPSWACAASAALVLAVGADDPITALKRHLPALAAAFAENLPDEVAELAPLRDELEELEGGGGLERLWLDKVKRDHGRLERYFQQHTDLDLLARVYVELDLAPEARRRSAEKGAGPPDRPPGDLSQLLELEPGSAPWVTGRWVVLGDPGAGKTTLLRHLAASLGREAAPPWVPVYESLPGWLRQPEALPQRLERRLRRAGHPAQGFASLCEQLARDGRLLLLLDGLDEVPREERAEAEELLRELVARWPATPMVVASRPIGYRPPAGGFTELRLLPLDRDRRRELLARWLGRETKTEDWDRADEALAVLGSDRSLWELSGNPLYLTLMAMLLEDGTTPERNRARLYDQIFDLLMAGKHHPEPQPMDAEETVRGVLRRLAYGMTEDNADAEPVTHLESRLLEEALDPLRKKLERRPRWRHSLRRFFDDLAERTGILGPHDGDEADWRYWHRTFREALAAERLEEQMSAGGRDAVLVAAKAITETDDASRWAEPYALLTGRVDEPDRLVRELVDANRDLGLRALASARTLKPETVPEILGLGGDVEERGKVYAELPRLIDDGRALLALVDRLRSDKKSGDDLFWLDWVVRQVARRDDELAPEAEALLDRFYEHIPAPPAELFTRVETRDGRVPLWCDVPAGEFRMGSPEKEEGRWGDEGPRHRVTLRSSFRIAAVPVTRAQYRAFDPDHVFEELSGIASQDENRHPADRVSWYAAVAFCRWLSQALPETASARLPTEAEWEYACRAGSETAYCNGDGEAALAAVGWYGGNSDGRTHPVGEKRKNEWDLYDVHGNVHEWTLSRWSEDYSARQDGVTEDPAGLSVEAEVGDDPSAVNRVIRGGSYAYVARDARSACRDRNHPWFEWRDRGFRVVLARAPSGGA